LRGMGVRLLLRSLTRDQLIRMWRSCFLTGIEVVLAMALFRIDALMLEAIAGARELGSYAVAYRLMETVLFVTWAVTRSMFPSMVRAGSGRPLLEVGENALAVVAAIFVPYGIILCIDGTALLRLIFGAQYAEGSTASLQWLAFAPLAFALYYCNSNLLFARARTRQMLAAIIIGLICNVILNLILIREYGASGAASATTASYAVAGLVSTIFLFRKDGLLRMDRALFSAVAAALPMSATLVYFDLPVLLDICLAIVAYLAAYVALTRWRSPGQLSLLVSLVRRV
jgi:O-antigen/teichoic acid export membrane protein